MAFWHVCNGTVEKYKGQAVTSSNSAIVWAPSKKEALMKALLYNSTRTSRSKLLQKRRPVQIIT